MNGPARRFAIGESDFLLDGEPVRILSGAMHYFRVHPDHWADRIAKAAAMGLNTIETYVAWNAHSPRRGEFDTRGRLDLGRYLDLVAQHGMHAIVRPGPYICAEWDNGGLPAWLFADGAAGIRSSEPGYLEAVREYFEQLAPILAPRQIDTGGGPIVLVQVENEYGAYGQDKDYLKTLAAMTRDVAGITVPLITVDQPIDDMLEHGSLPDLHKTGSFGSRVAERLDTLARHQPTGPLMCSEFWIGWFDSWGGHHHTTDAAETARNLDELLGRGASVNIYMFHGGTNFGLTSGANDKGTYAPIVTSYDYDSPLDEAGNPTPKYWAMREVLGKYTALPPYPQDALQPGRVSEEACFGSALPLWDVLGELGDWSKHRGAPPSADSLGNYSGFTLYRTEIDQPDPRSQGGGPAILEVAEVRDRAQVFLDRRAAGVLARDHHDRAIAIPDGAGGVALDLLVEDQGRVDYGPRLGEAKGLIGPVTLNGRTVVNWQTLPLELDRISAVSAALRENTAPPPASLSGPCFARAEFETQRAADLFLDTSGWGKGVAWINGFCLGRYWSRGPQRTLYIPGPLLREPGGAAGANELIVFELHAAASTTIRFAPAPELGHTEV